VGVCPGMLPVPAGAAVEVADRLKGRVVRDVVGVIDPMFEPRRALLIVQSLHVEQMVEDCRPFEHR